MNTLDLNEQFVLACKNNDLVKVKDLLTNSIYKVDISYLKDSGLLQACKNGHYDIVEYLLTSPELKEHAHIHTQNDYALTLACEKQHVEIVDFLLHSPKLKDHINLFSNLKEIDAILDDLLHEVYDQAVLYELGEDKAYKLLKYIVCESGIEKNTNPDLEETIEDLVEYHTDFYKIYKANKERYLLEEKSKKIKYK